MYIRPEPFIDSKRLWFSLIILAIVSSLLIKLSPPVLAASSEQRALMNNGIYDFDIDPNIGCSASAVAVSATLPSSVPAVYKTIFEQAAAKAKINPQLLAAIFVTEHGNNWPNPNGPWASSPKGASGPFQFMPGTWAAYAQGGNIQSLSDSADAAARYLSAMGATLSSPLGTLDKPYQRKPPTMLYMAGSYNTGGGNMQRLTTPTSDVNGNGLYAETVNYVKNVYYLITTQFQRGNPGYGNSTGSVGNNTNGAALSAGSASVSSANCSGSGVVLGNIAKTALALAQPTPGHGPSESDATADYRKVMPTIQGNLVGRDAPWSDCGVFVATVMRSTGADNSYPLAGSTAQLNYAKNHPEKYLTFIPTDPSQLKAGDILVNTLHTYIYVGKQSSGYDIAAASHYGHVPEVGNVFLTLYGEPFTVVRIK